MSWPQRFSIWLVLSGVETPVHSLLSQLTIGPRAIITLSLIVTPAPSWENRPTNTWRSCEGKTERKWKYALVYSVTSWLTWSQVWSKRIPAWNSVSGTFLLQRLTCSEEEAAPVFELLFCAERLIDLGLLQQSDKIGNGVCMIWEGNLDPGRGNNLGLAVAAPGFKATPGTKSLVVSRLFNLNKVRLL